MEQERGFELALFGDVRLRVAGTPVPLGRRAKALLAYLALARDRQATRDRLCGLLWPDRGEPQARASLRQCLLDVRAAAARADPGLADDALLAADRGAIALNGALASDFARLEVMARGPAEPFAQKLAEVAGEPLLDGLELGDSWDEWLLGARAQLEARLATVVHARLEVLEAARDWDALARLAETWTTRDPLDEVAVGAAIRADMARDAGASARRRYRALADRLARDRLGEPGEAVRAALATTAPPRLVSDNPPSARETPWPGDAPPLVRVAPFLDVELGGGHAHLAAALRDEIVSGLARYRDIRLVAGEANAGGDGYTLLASLRPAGAAIALATQLLHRDREVVWAERFELPLDALQTTVERIVGRIVAAVVPALNADMLARTPPQPAHGLYNRYLAARQRSMNPADHAAALAAAAELEAIIDADPTFAFPLLPLARLYNTDFAWTRANSSNAGTRARAFELARSALALDRGHIHAWTLLGWCHMWHGGWSAARQHFDTALTLNPFHIGRVLEIAVGTTLMGDLDMAAAMLERARQLDPRAGDAYYGDKGLLHLVRGEHEHAAACFDMVAAPDLWMTVYTAANAALAGHPRPALIERAVAVVARIHPGGAPPPLPALIDWVTGSHPARSPALLDRVVAGIERSFRA